jgi:hypothetical protein
MLLLYYLSKKGGKKMFKWLTRPFVGQGISLGSALAMILSYDRNQSILWAILHGILSWFYVIYVALLKVGIF